MYDEEARDADIVITTALIPGRPAPQLITAETVAAMQPGSVIVDMAAANGGNVRADRGRRAGRHRQPRHDPRLHRPRRPAAAQTSQLYGTNIVNLLKLLTPGKDGELVLDLEDVVAARHHRGPRRRVAVAAAAGAGVGARPGRRAAPRRGAGGRREAPPDPASEVLAARRSAAVLFSLVAAYSPAELPRALHRLRARGLRRLLRHLQRRPRAAHAADGRDQRDLRDHPGRRASCRSAATTPWSPCSRSSPCSSPASTSSVASW